MPSTKSGKDGRIDPIVKKKSKKKAGKIVKSGADSELEGEPVQGAVFYQEFINKDKAEEGTEQPKERKVVGSHFLVYEIRRSDGSLLFLPIV